MYQEGSQTPKNESFELLRAAFFFSQHPQQAAEHADGGHSGKQDLAGFTPRAY